MTGVTNCEGMSLSPALAYSKWHTFPSSITIKNTNIETTPNPYPGREHGATWWLTHGSSCDFGPILLADDYSDEPGIDSVRLDLAEPEWQRMRRPVLAWAVSWTDARMNGVIPLGRRPAEISCLLTSPALATCHLDTSSDPGPDQPLLQRPSSRAMRQRHRSMTRTGPSWSPGATDSVPSHWSLTTRRAASGRPAPSVLVLRCVSSSGRCGR